MVNSKRYVGQTVQPLKRRFNSHAHCKKSLIGKAIRKYGKENFRYGVIKSCASKAEMDYWEKYFIAAFKSNDKKIGYNQTDGGEGTLGYKHTPENIAKFSAAKKGENNYFFGKHLSEEHRAKIGASNKGRTISPEYCRKLSIAKTGKPLPPETCVKMAEAQQGEKNHNYGKPCAPEISAKISLKNRGNTKFQNLLKEIVAHNLSYYRLATLLGLSYPSVSAKMLGRLKFTTKDAAKLEEIFGKPKEYLLKQEICAEMPVKAQRSNSPYKNLIAELDACHLSYEALAKLMGAIKSNISRKIRGERNFTELDKAKLVEVFNKPIEYLLARGDG